MKRTSQGGSSPASKHSFLSESDSEEFVFQLHSQSSQGASQFSQSSPVLFHSQNFLTPPLNPSQSSSGDIQFGNNLLPSSQGSSVLNHSQVLLTPPNPYMTERTSDSESDSSASENETAGLGNNFGAWQENISSGSDSSFNENQFESEKLFGESLNNFVTSVGRTKAAKTILENEEIKSELAKLIFSEAHKSLKTSLKRSQLTTNKQDRKYLLSLTPRGLCEEFREIANPAFLLLVRGLLGVSEPEDIFESQYLLNVSSLIYSTVSKTINNKASGYALLLTTAARDGGLREDSLRLFSSILVHPRTSQKYDKSVLSAGWNTKMVECLKKEKDHFDEQLKAAANIEKLLHDDASAEAIAAAKDNLENLLDTAPAQTQLVWDNLNLRMKHRFERSGDDYSKSNLDWMGSLWVKDRINANHMDHREGVALKDAENLSIKDFLPSENEKDYIFMALVNYFSYRLVQRHPSLFHSIAGCIKQSRPHQFQDAMDEKSEEYTGNLFTKSESRTEDLITMMAEVQLNVHTFVDKKGDEHCHEKKIVSGDNKTEKNMHYGILRLTCNTIR